MKEEDKKEKRAVCLTARHSLFFYVFFHHFRDALDRYGSRHNNVKTLALGDELCALVKENVKFIRVVFAYLQSRVYTEVGYIMVARKYDGNKTVQSLTVFYILLAGINKSYLIFYVIT